MTKPKDEMRAAAVRHGTLFAMPVIRSMYPSESRAVVADAHADSFLAGARWGLERAAALFDGGDGLAGQHIARAIRALISEAEGENHG